MSGSTATLPPALATLLADLEAAGHETHLVGRCVLDLFEGRTPRDYELATSADAPTLLARFPRAVPLAAARARLMLPTPAGPLDLVPHAAAGGVRGMLARRDFTLHALALGADGVLLDPCGARADLRAGRLRCVGHPEERLAEDPLRALRALRLVAERDLVLDPALRAALPSAAGGVAALPAARLRAELHPLLLGPAAGRALALLRECGLEAVLAQGVADDAARVVDALPAELELRLAAWLRGARAVRALRRLREPQPRVVAVERLLQLHPVDARIHPSHDVRLRRLRRRSGALLPGLLALREAEIAVRGEGEPARLRLERLRTALERAAQPPRAGAALALDGRAVMEILGCAPGPEVGRALDQLAKAVEADPACNTPEALRERLLAWRSGQ